MGGIVAVLRKFTQGIETESFAQTQQPLTEESRVRIQINHDEHIRTSAHRADQIEDTIRGTLQRFEQAITGVEVHLSDENGPKFGSEDKRCLIEARVAHAPPIAVSHRGATLQQAVSGAAGKLERSIHHLMGRRRRH